MSDAAAVTAEPSQRASGRDETRGVVIVGMGESIRRSSYIVALRAGVILVLAVLLAACGSGTTSGTSSEEPNEAGSETESTPPGSESREALPTVEPGVLTVALAGDAPYAMSHGEGLEGIDGDIINAIAGQLGLAVRPSLMDFSAGIESVSTGRVDMLIGGVGWSEERSEVMYLTDEIYYVNIAVAQQEGRGIQSFEDMDGLIGGSITGFSLVPELQAVPGVAEVRLYDTNDAVLRDVVEGRIDFALLDPFAVELAAQEHPDWGIEGLPLQAEEHVTEFPILGAKVVTVMAVRSEGADLGEAINGELANLWGDCSIRDILGTYVTAQDAYFEPPTDNPRAGVDRPEDDELAALGDC